MNLCLSFFFFKSLVLQGLFHMSEGSYIFYQIPFHAFKVNYNQFYWSVLQTSGLNLLN